MTSEGQYAGEPPADATSGGPAQPFRDDRFPPDPGEAGEAGQPTSYAPPPQSTPNGGSPFVVPAVFGQSSPGPTAGYPPPQSSEPSGRPPADVAPRHPASPPPRSGSAGPPGRMAGSARVPGTGEGGDLPRRDMAPPARDSAPPTRGTAPATGSASVPGAASSPWGPPPRTAGAGPYGKSAEPHPRPPQDQRTGEPSGGFTGFPPGSEGDDRPPSGSPFGDQRPRVPGATLAGLPDAPRREPGGRASPDRFQPFGAPRPTGEPSQGFPQASGEPSQGFPQASGEPSQGFPQASDQRPQASPPASGERSQGFPPTSGERSHGFPQASDERSQGFRPPAGEPSQGLQQTSGERSHGFAPAPGEPSQGFPRISGERPQSFPPASDERSQGFRPHGGEPSQGIRPFGSAQPAAREPGAGFRPFGRSPGEDPAGDDRPASGGSASGGSAGAPGGSLRGGEFVRRVPGASLAASGMPDAPDAAGAGVPQPRDPAERPSTGTARAVSASASVPMPSRIAPSGPDEEPPPAAAQARVYGRPVDTANDDRRDRGPAGTPPLGRISASASVAPPHSPAATPAEQVPPADESPDNEPPPFGRRPPALPYGEPTTGVAGRGRAHVPPRPEYYGELTTDISRRGSGPERPPAPGPIPTWPPQAPGADQDRDRPLMGGVFPGPGSSAAAAPPSALDQPGGWPPYTEQSRFGTDQSRFGTDQSQPDPFQAEQPNRIKPSTGSGHVRMFPVLLSVVIGAILLVGIAIGIVWLISRGSDSSFDVGAGDCVRRSGNTAVKATCSDAGAYQVVSVVDTKDQCADKSQPYVLNPTKDGKTQVLCLKPSGG
jgi:collagen type III alpha